MIRENELKFSNYKDPFNKGLGIFNFNSLITKIVFLFVVSIVLFIIVFIGNYYYERSQLHKQLNDNYTKIARHIHKNKLSPLSIKNFIKELNFEVLENSNTILKEFTMIGTGNGFEIYKNKENFFILIHGPDFLVFAKDLDNYSLNYYVFLILFIVFIIFILSFLWIINTLKPLRLLKEQIKEFSNGNLLISCKSNKKDEIAEVSNEFDSAVKKISLLLNSRQLFLRTVMHELKTPIAKGKIVGELIEDEKQKNRIISIFDKLNFLINDFSKVEEIVSQNYKINKYFMSLNLIIEKAIDMMMLDSPKTKIKYQNVSKKTLNVDLELFALAIKNLLDNGVKYSIDKKVKIEEKDNILCIISKGEALSKPLEDYFKAYHNETELSNHGMGLGLYIVHEILKMHQMSLIYEHIDGENIFKINL